jgi:hypothetical protein
MREPSPALHPAVAATAAAPARAGIVPDAARAVCGLAVTL